MEDKIKVIESRYGTTDPFPFLFREIDSMHDELKYLKKISNTSGNNKNLAADLTGFQNQLDRIEYKIEETYRRNDWLFFIGILNLLTLVAFLLKLVFF